MASDAAAAEGLRARRRAGGAALTGLGRGDLTRRIRRSSSSDRTTVRCPRATPSRRLA